jgi:hypothetical protein
MPNSNRAAVVLADSGPSKGFLLCYAQVMKAIALSRCLLGAAGAYAEDRSWSRGATASWRSIYPGGQDAQLWAFELRSWLVALGVLQENLELVAGSRQADRIESELSR